MTTNVSLNVNRNIESSLIDPQLLMNRCEVQPWMQTAAKIIVIALCFITTVQSFLFLGAVIGTVVGLVSITALSLLFLSDFARNNFWSFDMATLGDRLISYLPSFKSYEMDRGGNHTIPLGGPPVLKHVGVGRGSIPGHVGVGRGSAPSIPGHVPVGIGSAAHPSLEDDPATHTPPPSGAKGHVGVSRK